MNRANESSGLVELGTTGVAGSESCSGGVYTLNGAGLYQGFGPNDGDDAGHSCPPDDER
jgi:hypothetical protein